jgi:hypothetical protein
VSLVKSYFVIPAYAGQKRMARCTPGGRPAG